MKERSAIPTENTLYTDIYHKITDYSRGTVSHTAPMGPYNRKPMNTYKDKYKANEQIWTRDTENLPPGRNLKYGLGKTLNWLRVEVGRTKKKCAVENRRKCRIRMSSTRRPTPTAVRYD